jgi:hypothetical protein
MPQRRAVFFLHGLPDYEALFPLACHLAARGVPVNCFGASAAPRREPRLRGLVAKAPVPVRLIPNRLLKRFSGLWLKPGDVPVVLADPAYDRSATGRRGQHILRHGIDSIFVQHGVIQTHVNYPLDMADPQPFHSALLLLYGPPQGATAITEEARGRARQVGFLKRPLFAPRPPSPAFRQLQSGFARTVLLCHSFRWQARYSGSEIESYYSFVRQIAGARPDHLFILRGHRGKARAMHREKDAELLRAVPNVVLSNAHSGPLKAMDMHDVLDLADLTISTASTAILDSLYRGRMAAVFRNEHPVFQDLPNIETAEDALRFLDAPPQQAGDALLGRFGEVDANLDRAADEIADFLAR